MTADQIVEALSNDKWRGWTPLFLLVLSVVITLCTTLGTLLLTDLKEDVAKISIKIEKVSDEAHSNNKEIRNEIAHIKAELATVPKEVPPRWFWDMVVENRKRIEKYHDENGTR